MKKQVNLAQFGVDKIGYANLKASMRYFGVKFNEFYGLEAENQTATESEIVGFLLQYAINNPKANKITDYFNTWKAENGFIETVEEEKTDKVAEAIKEIKEKQAKELLELVAEKLTFVVTLDETVDRSVIVDLETADSKDVTKKKVEKTKTVSTKTQKDSKIIKNKVDVIEAFEKAMNSNEAK